MSDQPYKKKLIEVALPLDAINAESAREKSIRQGHPSTLHLWWARRPLAACRAVLFGQLVDDPSAHPEAFPTEAEQDAERSRLFKILEDLVKWENSTNQQVLDAAIREIRRSCNGAPPPILDPFAGGGSIPLEAQRLGLNAYASDLNPVAVLINKALIEIPPLWADRPPIHSDAEIRTEWRAAEGLAEDVRLYGGWMRDEAEKRLGQHFPLARLRDGSETKVIAWIWARTVTCSNPACGATVPLVRSFWLGKKKGKETWVKPVVEGTTIRYEIGRGPQGPDSEGTVSRSGAHCLCCRESMKLEHVRSEGRAGRLGTEMIAIAAEGDRQREYLPPADDHVAAAKVRPPEDLPTSELPGQALGFRVQAYGLKRHADLFSPRQLTVLSTLSDLVAEARQMIHEDARMAGMDAADAESYAASVGTYLALLVGKAADRYSTLCGWDSSKANERPRNTFSRQTVSMVWDFAEADPFNNSSGNLAELVMHLCRAIRLLPARGTGVAIQSDARTTSIAAVAATDPPYYDNIGYSDLSDFFYTWLRGPLRDIYPDLFATVVTPKSAELIADPARHGSSREDADQYFEDGFVSVFEQMRDTGVPGFPLSFFYAFKQSEDTESGELASTGWSTMLDGLLSAGLMVTSTWPMRTESGNRMRSHGSNALASSVVLTCRPRPSTAGIVDRQGLVRSLEAELPISLRELQKAHIAPVDLRQAAIGPGMAVFSRFARVIEPNGDVMRVRTALGLINEVLDQVLDEQEQGFDAETRWAIQWFSQFFFDEGAYGTAEQLAVSMNVAVGAMVESGIVRSGGGKVQLLARNELPLKWDPVTDLRTPIWEATHHLVKRLVEEGEVSAARLLRRMGSAGDAAQLLAYRLYTVCERTRPSLAGPYNSLVTSWPELQRLAREATEPVGEYEQQTLEGS